jgi:hypothetical protein
VQQLGDVPRGIEWPDDGWVRRDDIGWVVIHTNLLRVDRATLDVLP